MDRVGSVKDRLYKALVWGPAYSAASVTVWKLHEEPRTAKCFPAASWTLKTMMRKIVNFHQDEEKHWAADLECGHCQHVRHDPPLMNRPWVLTPEGRERLLGHQLNCLLCGKSP